MLVTALVQVIVLNLVLLFGYPQGVQTWFANTSTEQPPVALLNSALEMEWD